MRKEKIKRAIAVIKWKLLALRGRRPCEEKVEMTCPVCGTKLEVIGRTRRFWLLRCPLCGFNTRRPRD